MNNFYDKIKGEKKASDQRNFQFLCNYIQKRASRGSKRDSGVSSDLLHIIQNEKLKDFVVKVGDEEFKVHKFLLAARSPVLAQMIENNIDAEELNLTDISTEIFHEIVNFMYTDKLPKSNEINFIQLFAAGGRLKIQKLKEFAAEKLMDKISEENALEILTLANIYENDELRQKSFDEIIKILGDVKIKNSFSKQPEKVKKLLEIKKKKQELDAKFEAILKDNS